MSQALLLSPGDRHKYTGILHAYANKGVHNAVGKANIKQ